MATKMFLIFATLLILFLLSFPSIGGEGSGEWEGSSGNEAITSTPTSSSTELVATEQQTACGPKDLTATVGLSGSLHSPNYPNSYPPNSDCWWTITAPPGYLVQISVTAMQLGPFADTLGLYDSFSQAGATEPYATLSSDDVSSASILSNSNYVSMLFTSDGWIQGKGFALTYKATAVMNACPTLPTLNNGEKACYADRNNNAFCKFSCHTGFKLSGSEQKWCLTNRTWTGNDVTCEKRSCTDLAAPDNGTMRCTDGNYCGSRCDFICNGGSELVGSESRMCGSYLRWSGWVTSCHDCGPSILNATASRSGTLHSPNYPRNYPPNFECWWTISASPSSDHRLQIKVNVFDLEKGYDFLELYDAPSQAESKASYAIITSEDLSTTSILSDSNYVTMKFASNAWTQRKGFQLTYKAIVVTCSALQTPSNGRKICYVDNNSNCYCKFSCDRYFKLFGSERRLWQSSGTWTGDRVTCEKKCFEQVAPENGSMRCTDGNNVGSTCTFTCNDEFQLTGSESRMCAGYLIWSGSFPRCHGCGPSILNATTSRSGSMNSPNYPLDYPSNSECWWTITAPPGYRVEINFTTVELLKTYDFLGLYDASSQVESKAPYATITSEDVSATSILSESKHVTIKFKSNRYVQHKGFELIYKATAVNCPTVQTPSNGEKICYVGNTNNCYCMFSCRKNFKLSGSERRWWQSNGTWTGNKVTCEKKCSELAAPGDGEISCTNGNNINSRCNFTCHDGYELIGRKSRKCKKVGRWSGRDTWCQGCGPSILNATASRSGSLHSPSYPRNYPPNFECWWTITAPPGYRVQFKFATFDLETADLLELYDAASQAESKAPYATISYGDVSLSSILSESKHVTIKFKSNRYVQRKGFELMYKATAVNCPALQTPSNGRKICYVDKNNFYSKFSCRRNFKLFGSEQRMCLPSGSWTGNQVTCEKKCIELSMRGNGEMRCTDGNNLNSRCNFTCNDSYELFGSESRTCEIQTMGVLHWSGYYTSCQGSSPTPACYVQRWQMCDGRYDCPDRSDEKGCTCPHSQFKCDCYESGCPTGIGCISQTQQCDEKRINHCGDMSDERDCQCSDTRFQCKDGDCIDRSKVNDGSIDCVNGDDEFICNMTQGHVKCDCLHDDDQCTSSDRCIPSSWIGDTIPDCENHDDEPCNASKVWCDGCWVIINQCSTNQSKNMLLQTSGDNATRCSSITIISDKTQILETTWICTTSPCGKCMDVFRCGSGQFIDNDHYCDTIPHCNDGSDELVSGFGFRCSGKSRKGDCILPQENVYDSVAHCADSSDLCFVNGEFQCFFCLDGRLIVSAKQVCDGSVDCYDMSDECLCSNQSVCDAVRGEESSRCPSNQMHCNNDTDCVYMDNVLCNSSVDCPAENIQRFCHQDQRSSEVIRCLSKYFDQQEGLVSNAVFAKKCDGRPECSRMEDECNDCAPRPSFCDSWCGRQRSNFGYGNEVCDGYVKEVVLIGALGNMQLPSCDREVEKKCPMRFYCTSGDMVSIDKQSVCDGIIDCDDHSDEITTSCDKKRFYCAKGKAVSIDKAFVCNGIEDCDKGEDEDLQMCSKRTSLFSDQYEMISNPGLRALFWIMGLLALSGNTIISIITAKDIYPCKNHNAVKLANDIFVLNLSLSDFLMGVYLIAVVTQGKIYSGSYGLVDKEWRSSNFCSGLGTLAVLSSETSVFIMASMSTFRLVTIYKPFLSSSIKIKWIVIAGCSCWIFSFLLAAIPWFPFDSGYFISDVWFPNVLFKKSTISKSDMFTLAKRVAVNNSNPTSWFIVKEVVSDAFQYNPIKGEFGYYSETSVCMPRFYASTIEAAWEYSTSLITLNFALFVYMVVAYVLVYKKASAMKKSRSTKKDPNKGMQKRISRLLLTDFCCWIPVCIMCYFSVAGVTLPGAVYIASAGFLLPINSAMNPILYSKFIDQQASQAKKWIKEKFTCICSSSADVVDVRDTTTRVDVLRVLQVNQSDPTVGNIVSG